jgi:hypothetical protein
MSMKLTKNAKYDKRNRDITCTWALAQIVATCTSRLALIKIDKAVQNTKAVTYLTCKKQFLAT